MKRFQAILVLLLLFGVTTPTGAADHNTHPQFGSCTNGSTYTLDNDHGAINSDYNSYYGPWTYESGSNSYNGDHRYIVAPAPSRSAYEWRFRDCSSLYGKMSAYIWNTKFYNPNVHYRNTYWYPTGATSYDMTVVMNTYLDQGTAPGGWNVVGKSNQAKTGHLEIQVYTTTSNGVGGIGADAAKVYYSTY